MSTPAPRCARGTALGSGQLSVTVGIESLERTQLPFTPLFAGRGSLGIRQLSVAIGIESLEASFLVTALTPIVSLAHYTAFVSGQHTVTIGVILLEYLGAPLIAVGLVVLRLNRCRCQQCRGCNHHAK
jgi:hypothetical protein